MVKKGFLSILASTAICLTVALSCGSEERNRTTRKTSGEKTVSENGLHNAPSDAHNNAAESAKDFVEPISSLESLNSIVESNPGKLLVFDLYADWCAPCKILAPLYSDIAKDHAKKAQFFRVDVQRNQDIASAFRVRGIPYVVFIKDKEVVHALAGLNTREQYERVITSCGNDIPLAECKKHLEQSL